MALIALLPACLSAIRLAVVQVFDAVRIACLPASRAVRIASRVPRECLPRECLAPASRLASRLPAMRSRFMRSKCEPYYLPAHGPACHAVTVYHRPRPRPVCLPASPASPRLACLACLPRVPRVPACLALDSLPVLPV